MKNGSSAEMTATFTGLFNLREGNRTSPRAIDVRSVDDLSDTHLVVHPDADPIFVEQYRRLGAALHQAQLQDGTRSVLVASAVAEEGKTLSATNLALTLSESFKKRVLLVDGDLRKPSVHELLELQNGSGLTDMLKRPGETFTAQIVSPTLSVVTAGTYDPDPVALLVSDAAVTFFAQARDRFDWVVVDTPPIVLFPDAGLFADRVDTCVMVVSATTTGSPAAASAVTALGPSRILGVLLNRAAPSEIAAGYGYSHYGYPKRDGHRRPSAWWRKSRG